MTKNHGFARFIWGALIALAAVSVVPVAHAKQADRIGHFQTLDGSIGFVLDLSGETPRQRFDDSPEILLLKPIAAARGDTIYRRSDGRIVIRGTPFGALTLYSSANPGGLPVVRVGPSPPLLSRNRTLEEVLALGPGLERHLDVDENLAIHVEIPSENQLGLQTTLNTLGDAIENTRLALDRMLVAPDMASDIGKTITAIRFDLSGIRAVDVDGPMLIVHIIPKLQVAGRPSSYDIAGRLRLAVAQQKANVGGLSAESSDRKRPRQHSFDFRW